MSILQIEIENLAKEISQCFDQLSPSARAAALRLGVSLSRLKTMVGVDQQKWRPAIAVRRSKKILASRPD
jgi:hypothetical protein